MLLFSPFDISPSANAALASTLWIATWWVTEAIPIPATSLREEGERALSATEMTGEPDISVVTSIREGVPHEELLTSVEDRGIDLAVMDAKGRSAFKRFCLEAQQKRSYGQIASLSWSE